EAQDLKLGAPVFLRIIKTNPDGAGYRGGRIEAFVQKKEGGAFTLFKTYDICAYSGRLGPKTQQGDNQAPEGFYFVTPSAMNPYSSYHLSFNLGYPNAYDRSHGRTGNYLMVHGKCGSIGCYAMGNAGVEEIYTLMSAAFAGGQSFVRVHAFPFDMSPAALARHKDSAHAAFWANLKQGWDAFELAHIPPDTRVENGRYIFENAAE
ncbi:MAG: L,D-transpeptidase family protein, partial [Robiginitomaculum sp.]